jgi:hypothetical protein
VRSLLVMTAVAATATLLSGCRDKKPEPVPGPQSALAGRARADAGSQANTWTPGTEAFAAPSSKESRALFRD